MEGPLAKAIPSSANRYSIRTFVLDDTGLRFRGKRRFDGEVPAEHFIDLGRIESLAAGTTVAPEGTDFEIGLRDDKDGPFSLQLRARSREEAFRWLLAISVASGVKVTEPQSAASSRGPLPDGWEEITVPKTAQTYYRHSKTRQQQWTRPTARATNPSEKQRSTTGVADDTSAAEAAADAERLGAEIKFMKAARGRKMQGRFGMESEAPTVARDMSSSDFHAGTGDGTSLQPEITRRALELQMSIAELSSRRQARRHRRRDERKKTLWNAGGAEDAEPSDNLESGVQPLVGIDTPDEFASLSSEERVAARMAQLLHAAIPNEDARRRVCDWIANDGDRMTSQRQGAIGADSGVRLHPVAPIPTFADGTFVAAAIIDKPTSTHATNTSQSDKRSDPATATLRAELEQLRPSELRRRALRAQVPASVLREAQDSADPKANMIDLLVQYETYPVAAATGQLSAGVADIPEGQPPTSSETELVALQPSALRRQAFAMGIERSKLDQAQDSENPKQAFAQLILEQQRQQDQQSTAIHQTQGALAAPRTGDMDA